ncbi:MAG: octaprenyl diphosphate synthase, partial [Methylophilaceae bacterium]|nr:octaprenyl diphosphate synthase [Methylophilaceae bacterium]
GKNLGDDIAEGKPTLPLLYAMRHGNQQQAQLIRTAIEQGGEHNIQSVIDAVQQTDALQHVRILAQQEAHLACQAIAHFPVTPAKQRLIELAEFSVTRDF